MSDNNDKLNDILNEIDNKKNEEQDPQEEFTAEETAFHDESKQHEEHYEEPQRDYYDYDLEEDEEFDDVPPYLTKVHDDGDRRRKNSAPKKKKKKKKRRGSRLPGVLILVTLIFGISIISSLLIIGVGKDMLGIDKSDKTNVIVVPDGATIEDISLMLKNDNIIKYPEIFTMFANLRQEGMTFISGEHFVRPDMPYETIIDELTKLPTEEMGESIQVTFPEGINLIEAAQILEENGICDASDFIFYFNSGGFGVNFEELLPIDTSMKFQRMEGYLFPDTYFFYQNSTPEEVCQKIYYNFDTKMNSELTIGKKTYETRYKRMEELNLNLDQLITFASIVQKEAATTDVMTNVASVFWNRLNNADEFPKLQSDPTSNYSNNVIRPNMEYFDQVKVDAYDTYKSPGLPPGAICNPGIEAIDAVLEAYESDWFYFIANINTKETYFSETLEEHEENQAMIEEQYAAEAASE